MYFLPSIFIVTQWIPCFFGLTALQMNENAYWTVCWQLPDSQDAPSLLIFRRDEDFTVFVIVRLAVDTAVDTDHFRSCQSFWTFQLSLESAPAMLLAWSVTIIFLFVINEMWCIQNDERLINYQLINCHML